MLFRSEKKAKFAGKSEAELKSMARRHGYGPDSNEYSKHGSFEKKQIDELYGKGSLGKIKGHHEKEAKKAYKKFDKVSGLSKLDALEKKGEHHYAQSERASDLMSKASPKPGRGGDKLAYRTPSKGLVTRGPTSIR